MVVGATHVYECVRAHSEAKGGYSVPCSAMFCLIPLRQHLSLKLELGWQTPTILLSLCPTLLRLESGHHHTCLFMWVFGQNSGIYACATSTHKYALSHVPSPVRFL